MDYEIKIDLFFAFLLLVPVLIQVTPPLRNKLIKLSQGKNFSVLSLPISAYLIYDISINNIFGLIGLVMAYLVFFTTYAAAISLLSVSTKRNNVAQ